MTNISDAKTGSKWVKVFPTITFLITLGLAIIVGLGVFE